MSHEDGLLLVDLKIELDLILQPREVPVTDLEVVVSAKQACQAPSASDFGLVEVIYASRQS